MLLAILRSVGFLEPEEVAELYRRKGALVLRRCRRNLDDSVEAEDALQEVFIRVIRFANRNRTDEIPLSWLYRTADRCCFDLRKKMGREDIRNVEDASTSAETSLEAAPYDVIETIERFFDRLDDKLKRLAVLYYMEGLSQEQIADELGWSRRTVGKKVKLLRERAEKFKKREKA